MKDQKGQESESEGTKGSLCHLSATSLPGSLPPGGGKKRDPGKEVDKSVVYQSSII